MQKQKVEEERMCAKRGRVCSDRVQGYTEHRERYRVLELVEKKQEENTAHGMLSKQPPGNSELPVLKI